MAILLIIDTSGTTGIAAISDGSAERNIRFDQSVRSKQNLDFYVQRLLSEYKISLDSISNLAVGIGPGKFIRTRIGIAYVNGIASATGLPITEVDSMAALAYACIAEPREIGALRVSGTSKLTAAHHMKDPDAPGFDPRQPWSSPPHVVSPRELERAAYSGVRVWAVDGDSERKEESAALFEGLHLAQVYGDAMSLSLVRLAEIGIKQNRLVKSASPIYPDSPV